MNRRTFLGVASGTAAFLGCRKEASTPGRRVVNVGITPRSSMSGLFVAQERGYFDEAGIEVQPHQITRSPQLIPLTASGELDACLPSINTAFVNAVSLGARLAIVAARLTLGGVCGTSNVLYGNASSFPEGLDDLRRVKHKRVAIPGTHTFIELALDAMLGSVGLTVADVELVLLQQEEAVAALFSGRIDALMARYLSVDPAKISARYVKGPALADLMPDLQRGFVLFGPTLLNDNI